MGLCLPNMCNVMTDEQSLEFAYFCKQCSLNWFANKVTQLLTKTLLESRQ